MEYAMGIGIVVGIVIAFGVWILIAKLTSNDTDSNQSNLLGKGEYDERQAVIRGKGTSNAYTGTLIGLGILFVLDLFWTAMPKAVYSVGVLFIIFASVTYFAVYCIRKDAFMGITGQVKRYIILYAVVVGCNVLSFALNVPDVIRSGDPFSSVGVWMNGFCVAAFSIVLIALIVCRSKEEEEA